MSKIEMISEEEAIKIIEAHKDDAGSSIGLLCALLEGAAPPIKKYFEGQLLTMVRAGVAIGTHVAGLEPNTPEYDEMLNFMRTAANKSRVPNSSKEDSDG